MRRHGIVGSSEDWAMGRSMGGLGNGRESEGSGGELRLKSTMENLGSTMENPLRRRPCRLGEEGGGPVSRSCCVASRSIERIPMG